MANLLKMAVSETIRTLHRRGWSQRRIADELGTNRETVARHLRQADALSKPAIAPTGSEADNGAPEHVDAPADSTPAPQLRGSGRASGCEPWRDLIRAQCDLGFTAQRIYQDLVAEHGFRGTYYSVPVRPSARDGAPTPLPAHRMRPRRRSSDRLRRRRPGRWARRQAAQDPRPPRRPEPLPQGLQRGRLPPDHRRLPPLSGGRLPAFRRRSQATDPGQPQGGRDQGRLVRSRDQSQGSLVR
jgi:hypothetical protein